MNNTRDIFIKFDVEMQNKLLYIMALNPIIDFENAILLTLQDLRGTFRKYKENDIIDIKNIIKYYNKNRIYDFVRDDKIYIDNKLNFTKFAKIWEQQTKMKCYVNREVDDSKKEVFIIDNILWVSDLINDKGKAYYVLKTYTENLIKKENSLGIVNLIFLLINCFYKEEIKDFDKNYKKINTEITIPKIIYYSDDDIRYEYYKKTFEYYKEILMTFTKKFIPLNTLIDIINNDLSNIHIENNEIIKDIQNNNIPDFPYYFYE